MYTRWTDYTQYLVRRYGSRVYRIGIDGGFTCPHRTKNLTGGCIYCDSQGASSVYLRTLESDYHRSSPFKKDIDSTLPLISNKSFLSRLSSIDEQIIKGKKYLDTRFPNTKRSIYFQAYTNTFDTIEHLKALYDRALEGDEYVELIVSTRPDCINQEIVDLLCSYKNRVQSVWVELGLQSGNEDSLVYLNRGHSAQDYIDAVALLKNSGIEVSTHIILGIPGEGDEDILNTASIMREVKSEAIKIHNLHIVAGTSLYDSYKRGEVEAPEMADHLHNTILFLTHIDKNVVIQRLVSDTPRHRLASPRDFPDKGYFLLSLDTLMKEQGVVQGEYV